MSNPPRYTIRGPPRWELRWARHGAFLFFKLNLWLCAMSVLLVAVNAYAVGISLAALGPGVALAPLLFYFIYVEDRRSVGPEDRINQPVRTSFVVRYSRSLLVSELLALLTYEALLWYYVLGPPGRSAWFLLLGHAPFVVLAGYDHVKRFPSGDSIAVAGTWGYVGVFTLVVSTGVTLSSSLAVAFLGWFLVVFGGVESRNLQDVAGDTSARKTTLAGHLGPTRMRALVTALKLAGVVVFWVHSGLVGAGLVVGYLLLLRSFRLLTRNAEKLVEGSPPGVAPV